MKTLHILLVEDNEGDILLTTEALDEMEMNIKLSIMKDGRDAIDFMSEECRRPGKDPVDLVLLDINLPKRNGHEVLKYIRDNKKCDHVPVIMLTTSSYNKDREDAGKNKADGYLIKPLNGVTLPAMIRALQYPDFPNAVNSL